MKIFLITLILLSSLINGFSQEKRIAKKLIPDSIKTYLQHHYPAATQIEFFKKKDKGAVFYEAEFELNKQDYNLRFSTDGNLLETEREIEFGELTGPVRENIIAALNENFHRMKIRKTQEVDPAGIKQYEVYIKVKKSGKFKSGFYKAMFDDAGKLLSIEKEKLESIESVF